MAGMGKRILARFIDGLIFMLIAFIGGIFFNSILPGSILHWTNLTYFIYLAYNVILVLKFGQTIGKRTVKLRVVDRLSRQLTVQQVLVRESIAFVVLYTLQIDKILTMYIPAYQVDQAVIIYFSFALLLVDLSTLLLPADSKQLLHDYLAKTQIVSTNNQNVGVKTT